MTICLFTVTFFYLEYNSLEFNSNDLIAQKSSSSNASQLYSIPKKTKQTPKQKPTPTPKPEEYGPIPFKKKMECESYHEKKGISFK